MFSKDPFLYLEDLHHADTQALIQQAQRQTQCALMDEPVFESIRQDMISVLQDEQQIPFCQEFRARMYHFYQSEEWPKGVYRVCSSSSYRAGAPQWQILFSIADFDAVLGDDVALQGVAHYVEAPEHVLISLSAAGGDAAYTIEFDLAKQCIVPDGFHFPLSKSVVSWRDEHSVWVCPAWDKRQCTQAGYSKQVWLLRRGQTFEEALPILDIDADAMMVNAWRYLDTQGSPIDLIEAATGFYHKQYYQVMADFQPKALSLPDDCELMGYLYGQLLVQLRSDWVRANKRYQAGSLVAVKLHKGELGAAEAIFVPDATQAIECVETTRRFVVVSVLSQVRSSLLVWQFVNGHWQAAAVPRLPAGTLEMVDQPWGGDVLYVAISDFTTPLTLYTLDLHLQELCVMRRQQDQFNAEGIKIQQHFATSADGTLVPYYHVGRVQGKEVPTLVYVYGGFGIPQLPYYLGGIGRYWLQRGYAFVLANVRGGGELGPAWHYAARGVNKHRSVDDLLAVLQDLYQHDRASAAYTAIQGGSNGGLMVASALCRAPELMGAVVCEVPLTDMLRYPYLSAGSSWLDEYGDPQDETTKAALALLSPYHHLAASPAYPPVLLSTHLNDDRVHPAHALKFYARLQELHQPVWLAATDQGGHGGSVTQADTAAELALLFSFLYQTIASQQITQE